MLHGDEVRADEGNMVDRPEHLDDTSMIDTGNEDSEEVGKECRLFLEVERQCFVVAVHVKLASFFMQAKHLGIHFDVGDPDNNILELVVFPSIRRTLDHGKSGIVLRSS